MYVRERKKMCEQIEWSMCVRCLQVKEAHFTALAHYHAAKAHQAVTQVLSEYLLI